MLKPSYIATDHSKVVLLLWFILDVNQQKKQGVYLMIFDDNSKIFFVKSL